MTPKERAEKLVPIVANDRYEDFRAEIEHAIRAAEIEALEFARKTIYDRLGHGSIEANMMGAAITVEIERRKKG